MLEFVHSQNRELHVPNVPTYRSDNKRTLISTFDFKCNMPV